MRLLPHLGHPLSAQPEVFAFGSKKSPGFVLKATPQGGPRRPPCGVGASVNQLPVVQYVAPLVSVPAWSTSYVLPPGIFAEGVKVILKFALLAVGVKA